VADLQRKPHKATKPEKGRNRQTRKGEDTEPERERNPPNLKRRSKHYAEPERER
jgi:hypothetical protein